MHAPSHVIIMTSQYSSAPDSMPPECTLSYKGQLNLKAAQVQTCTHSSWVYGTQFPSVFLILFIGQVEAFDIIPITIYTLYLNALVLKQFLACCQYSLLN